MDSHPSSFSDPHAVSQYADGPPRLVPGFAALQRMTTLLLEERTPENARILVLGAGGGLELLAFAQAQPTWRLHGVDPSEEMIRLARTTLGSLAARVDLQRGYIDEAPEGPFDGATCLLTLHFLTEEERRRTLAEVRRRLRPGAPFVVAHFSFPQSPGERDRWLSRYVAFAVSSGVEAEKAKNASAAIDKQLTILAPENDEMMLREAGFSGVNLFYAGLTFRGWVAYA